MEIFRDSCQASWHDFGHSVGKQEMPICQIVFRVARHLLQSSPSVNFLHARLLDRNNFRLVRGRDMPHGKRNGLGEPTRQQTDGRPLCWPPKCGKEEPAQT